jgi:hypothetical protein
MREDNRDKTPTHQPVIGFIVFDDAEKRDSYVKSPDPER